ncbi:MAG TPA: AAA family ATPase [Rubrobacteraceae bacterium]|nr:AAA family ATPase [Rubrobacteraceae bacterium]
MPDTKLFLLGPPRIERDGTPFEVDTRKAVALLAYLAITQEHHTRDALAGLLWPEYGQTRARAALRRTLSALSEARKEGWLIVDRESMGLSGDHVWVDVARFHELLAECRSHGHPETEVCPACLPPLTEAVALYRDDFLAGFGLRDSFSFDDWQYFQAETLRRQLAGALDRLGRGHGAREEWEPAIGYARRRLVLDPLHEPAHRLLMRLYALSGQRAAALHQYQECVRFLEKNLGVSPLEETSQLYQAIKEGSAPPFPSLASTSPEAPAPITPATHEAPSGVPFLANPLVGREKEWQILQGEYEAASTGSRFVTLEGEAGIGKTRLAEEFVAHARDEGAKALIARCYAGQKTLAYGPFAEMMEGVLDRPELAGLLEGLPAHLLSEASRLLPGLAELFPDLPPPPPFDTPGAQTRFLESITRVLLATCSAEPGTPPGILFLDDLQWADDASLDLLAYLTRRRRSQSLLVLATWREEEVPDDHRLRDLVEETRRAGTAVVLPLGRLKRAAVEELVSSVTGKKTGLLDQQLYDETEGLPLFLMEYLRAVAEGEMVPDSESWTIPRGVRDLLHGRLRRLSETGGQLLATAAVIGRSFDFDTVQRASGRSEEEAITALEQLVSRGLIREFTDDPSRGAPTYDFSHDKLRALVYDETNLARKRLLHRRTAGALADRFRGHRREIGPLAAEIAHHHQLAGQDVRAANYYKLAGEHARALYANAEALSHFHTALALGHPDTAGLHGSIGDLQTLGGDYGAAIASYETAAALFEGPVLADIERKLGNVHQRRGEWDLAETHYEAALEELGEAGSTGERARLYADRSLLCHRRGRIEEAVELAHRALRLAEEADEARALAYTHNLVGMLAKSGGDQETARYHLERSLALSETLEDPGPRVAALNNLALAYRASGETEQAINETEAALASCAAIGDRHHEAALHNNLADLLHATGQHEEAMSHLKKAVAIFSEIGEKGKMQPEIWKLVEW